MLASKDRYAQFVYSLDQEYASIGRISLAFYTVSSLEACLTGEIYFREDVVLRVSEVIDFQSRLIRRYSYAVSRGGEKLYWYDSQPHPDDPTLSSTYPHHKHVPPDIKHNRLPAPAMSFTRPNLPALIREIEEPTETWAAG